MVIQAGWGTYSTTMSIVMLSQRRQTDEQFEGWWGPLHNNLPHFLLEGLLRRPGMQSLQEITVVLVVAMVLIGHIPEFSAPYPAGKMAMIV